MIRQVVSNLLGTPTGRVTVLVVKAELLDAVKDINNNNVLELDMIKVEQFGQM